MSDPVAAVRKDIRGRVVGTPILVVVLVVGLWVLVVELGSLLSAVTLTVGIVGVIVQLRRGLGDRRAALRAFDGALAVLRADHEPGPPAPPVDVRLTGVPEQDRVIRWDGTDTARWHPDGTVTRLDHDPAVPADPPEATVRPAGAPDVEEVTLGDAVFVRWGTTWADAHGRSWTMPEARALEHGVTRFDWPSATGVDGLLAYLEHVTGRARGRASRATS